MTLAALVQLASACIGVIGSLFFAIGVMRQTIEAMGRLSGTYWDWNPHMIEALATQKADYLFGGGLICVAFVLQLLSFLLPSTNVLQPEWALWTPWAAVVATIIGFYLLRLASRRLARGYEAQISAWLKSKAEKDAAGAA